jgi:hypothetical protein
MAYRIDLGLGRILFTVKQITQRYLKQKAMATADLLTKHVNWRWEIW